MKIGTCLAGLVSALALMALDGRAESEIVGLVHKASFARGKQYVALRDRAMELGRESARDLRAVAAEGTKPWTTRLTAAIWLERIENGDRIRELDAKDWAKDPEYDPSWNATIIGPAVKAGKLVEKRLQEAGLWYHYLEMHWFETGEGPRIGGVELASVGLGAVVGTEAESLLVHILEVDLMADPAVRGKPSEIGFETGRAQRAYSLLIRIGRRESLPLLLRAWAGIAGTDTRYTSMQIGKILALVTKADVSALEPYARYGVVARRIAELGQAGESK